MNAIVHADTCSRIDIGVGMSSKERFLFNQENAFSKLTQIDGTICTRAATTNDYDTASDDIVADIILNIKGILCA